MKSVLLSVRPMFCELIANGYKTVELRKTRPKLQTPFKVYIYCTEPKRWFRFSAFGRASDESLWLENGKVEMCDGFKYWCNGGDYTNLNGKVIGEFVCDEIQEIGFSPYNHGEYICKDQTYIKHTGLTFDEMFEYLGEEYGYGWHISRLEIYDTPKPIGDFYKPGAESMEELEELLCLSCEATEGGKYASYGTPNGPIFCEGSYCNEAYEKYLDENFSLTRPPQSWCYVEETRGT